MELVEVTVKLNKLVSSEGKFLHHKKTDECCSEIFINKFTTADDFDEVTENEMEEILRKKEEKELQKINDIDDEKL